MNQRMLLRKSGLALIGFVVILNGCASRRSDTGNAASHRLTGTKYRRTVPLGMQRLQLGQSCALVNVSMSSENFFENLIRVDRDSTPDFLSNGLPVSSFPDELTVGISGLPVKCALSPTEGVPVRVNEQWRNDLSFHLLWQNGDSFQPVTGLAVAVVEPRWRELSLDWGYELSLVSAGIPITSTLIVQIQTKDGKQLAQFDGKLAKVEAKARRIKR